MIMVDDLMKQYIEKFMLKSGEKVEWNDQEIYGNLIEIRIVKQTTRTYRLVGILTMLSELPDVKKVVDAELKGLNLTPNKRVQLDGRNNKTLQWLEEGWILKEIRFEKDGKTIQEMNFRMGYRLFKCEQDSLVEKENKAQADFENIQEEVKQILRSTDMPFVMLEERREGIKNVNRELETLLSVNVSEVKELAIFPQKWSVFKRVKFTEFILSFIALCAKKEFFDWKEIGASYYRKIGGSKEFDSYKQDFIDQLEEWAKVSINMLGITSLGKITPLYFSGQLSGQYSSYSWGPVHALTDISIAQEEYKTEATTLWLVENRAIVTRLSAEKNFLAEADSLILCVDGHVRSSHKKCIQQVLENSELRQVIIWCDYDQDGLQIARELFLTVGVYGRLTIKWVTPNQEVWKSWDHYEEYMIEFLANQVMEQEQILGGKDEWKKWIH